MTPKDKAKDLVDEYFSWYGNEEYFSHEFAKQCALIAVEEILKLNHPIAIVYTETSDNLIEQYTQEYYWEQVKHEIEKL